MRDLDDLVCYRPVDLSAQIETCRIMSSLYHSDIKNKNLWLKKLLLGTSLSISKHVSNSFEVRFSLFILLIHVSNLAVFTILSSSVQFY